MGLLIAYQGIVAQSVHFRRKRGYGGDQSVVIFPAKAFPSGFSFDVPQPGTDLGKPWTQAAKVDVLKYVTTGVASAATKTQPPTMKLGWEGTLQLAQWSYQRPIPLVVEIPRLFVTEIETVKKADTSDVMLVKVTLVDERYLWTRGLLRRWSFNRLKADQTIALDSVKDDGKPWSRAEIAGEHVVASLFRGQKPDGEDEKKNAENAKKGGGLKLVNTPSEWIKDFGSVEFEPFGPAAQALAQLVTESGLEEPCLRLDGTLALCEAEDGLVGYAEKGVGPNAKPFPDKVRLYKDGTGQTDVVQYGYPGDFLVVRGEKKVVSVEVDKWEPVIVREDRGRPEVLPLNDETLATLTKNLKRPGHKTKKLVAEEGAKEIVEVEIKNAGNGYTMKWLKKWLLAPVEMQGDAGLPESLCRILREQAFRLWRIPGAITEERDEAVESLNALNDQVNKLTDQIEAAPPGTDVVALTKQRDKASAQLFEALDAGAIITRKPGPNARLLPLLARAETIQGGKRLPVKVETYRFVPIHQAMVKSQDEIDAYEATQAIKELEDKINRHPRKPTFDFGGNFGKIATAASGLKNDQSFKAARRPRLSVDDLLQRLMTGLWTGDERNVNPASLMDALQRARTVEEVSVFDSSLANLYKGQLVKRTKALDKLAFSANAAYYDLADAILDFEKKAAETAPFRGVLPRATLLSDELAGARATLEAKFREVDRVLEKAKREREKRQKIGADTRKPQNVVIYRNLDRAEDTGATVYNADLGIVRTSGIAGHLLRQDVSEPSLTEIVECPVRVSFGCYLRPRFGPKKQATGQAKKGALEKALKSIVDEHPLHPPEEDLIPDSVSDQETYYAAAFKRTARGKGEKVDMKDVPLDQASVVLRSDFVELVPIRGEGNKASLDEQSLQIALAHFRRPDRIETSTHVLGGPWPVQCDGLVESVEIITTFEKGAPLGFETHVLTGCSGLPVHRGTRVRPPKPSRKADDNREGLK